MNHTKLVAAHHYSADYVSQMVNVRYARNLVQYAKVIWTNAAGNEFSKWRSFAPMLLMAWSVNG